MPARAARRMKMLHHSPTRVRLRAIGQSVSTKLVFCISAHMRIVTIIMQVTGGQEQARLRRARETRRRAVRTQSAFLAETGLLMRVSGEQVPWALPHRSSGPCF